jgi:putative tryptophan/tyrosine transport system substrate-binding protein
MNIRRRPWIARGLLLLAAPGTALAQTPNKELRQLVRLGWLSSTSRESSLSLLAAFKAEMQALGWKEGEHYALVERWADNLGVERNAVLAGEVAAARPAIIVAAPNGAVRAALKAAPDTPIVMATGTDPVGWGFAASLAHPGGTVTGNANLLGDLSDKYPELLLAAAPGIRRVGFLLQPQGPLSQAQIDSTLRIAKVHSLDASIGEVKTADEVGPVLARFAVERVQALIVNVGPSLMAQRTLIAQTALQRKWPTIAFARQFADEGALMSYGPNFASQFRRAAYFVDRILKGAKPADLPFEQPTQVEFVVNRKTAKALGLTIPQSLLLRADELIE